MKKLCVVFETSGVNISKEIYNQLVQEFSDKIKFEIIDYSIDKVNKYIEVIDKCKCEYICFLKWSNINYFDLFSYLLKKVNNKQLYYINFYMKKRRKISYKKINLDKLFDGNYQADVTGLSTIDFNNCVFITDKLKKIKLEDFKFDKRLYNLFSYIKDIKGLEVLNFKVCVDFQSLNDDFSSIPFYFSYIDYLYDCAKEKPSPFSCYIILYTIYLLFHSNANDCQKVVFDKPTYNKFINGVRKILKLIDTDIIIKVSKKYNNNFFSVYLFKLLNYNNPVDYCSIELIDFDGKKINFDLNFPQIDRSINDNNVFVYLNVKKIKLSETKVYSAVRYFGLNIYDNKTFKFSIPLTNLLDLNTLNVYCNGNKLNLRFTRWASKLHENMPNSYWLFDKYVMKYNHKNILLFKTNVFKNIVNEIKFLFDIISGKGTKSKFLAIKCFFLRVLYWITKAFMKKDIWISYDKLYKAGDNGEYYFNYAKKRHNNTYYVLNKDSGDFKRLESNGNILRYRTLKQFLFFLNAKIIFSTHANPYSYNGFADTIEKNFRNLFNFDIFCIQHGLSVNRIDKFQNRVYANTKLYFCASKFEIKNLLLKSYDYDEKQLLLTGLPRFDGLNNKPVKQILITPTWRQNVSVGSISLNQERIYNPNFKQTEYFKIYNNLISNEKLLLSARKAGYKIIYMLHPAISSQFDDFDGNDVVQICTSKIVSYEDVLNYSSLMITDYSGVQFDFAYMRKPIVYYHPVELPPHYEESGLNYLKDGFGPIVSDLSQLVNLICNFIENDCQLNETYKKRVDNFFAFDDDNNCKRIYDAANKYVERKNGNGKKD